MSKLSNIKIFFLLMVLIITAVPAAAEVAVVAERDLPSSVTAGNEFQVTINISGYGQFGKINETLPDGFEFVRLVSTGNFSTTVTGNLIECIFIKESNVTYRVKAPATAGTYNFAGIIINSSKNQTNITGDVEMKVTVPTTTKDTSSGGGGGGGGSSGEAYMNIALRNVVRQYLTSNTPAEYTFTDELNPILGVTFTPLINKGYVNVVVEVLKNTSGLVSTTPPSIVYKNINIWAGLGGWANEQTISDAKIDFNVNKNWIVENNIDSETVKLYRYDAQWTELITTKTGEDSQKIYYSARTDRFSPFAVIAKTEDGMEVIDPGVPAETEPAAPTPPEEKNPGIPGFEAIAASGMIAAVYWMCRRKV